MFPICFNDSIPDNASNDTLVSQLSLTIIGYDKIKKNFSTAINGIITDREPSKLILNNSDFSLARCIMFLNRELRKIALANFNKYTIDNFLVLENPDKLLEMEYSIVVNKNLHDAMNAKIVEENNGILFTLSIHNDLKQNKLCIINREQEVCHVLNLFGEDKNTEFISNIIRKDLTARLGNFKKFLSLVGDCYYSDRFRKNFENLTSDTQVFLIKEIEYCIERKNKTRFYPDDKLIKDVTADKEKDIKVFELRVFSPVAVRMYFYETGKTVYLGGIEGKPKKKVQDSDILNAASTIKELIILNKSQLTAAKA